MSEIYRVILDIDGLEVYDTESIISNKLKKRYNEVEEFMDSERKKIDESLLSRKGAVYVCLGIENAHKWYKRIDANQQLDYYVYKLCLKGEIQWHDSKYYENVFMLHYRKDIANEMLLGSMYENVEKYWKTKISPDSITAEGLFWGEAIVLERKHYNHNQIEYPNG